MPGPAVLGINAAHDAAACLIVDGELRMATAEERLSRRKHDGGVPRRAIELCLQSAGLEEIGALDCVVINEFPHGDLPGELRSEGFTGELLVNPSHHLLHACYAAAACGEPESAILIVDGSGYSYAEHSRRDSPLLGPPPPHADMWESESSFALRDGKLELVDRQWGLWEAQTPFFRFPSLGHMFSIASQYIFGQWTHAGKTMGLAPYGDPEKLPEQIVTRENDRLAVDTEWILDLPPRSDKPAHLDELCCNVAAKVQAELEWAMLFLARRLFNETEIAHLSLSGGVALNSVANARLRAEGPFSAMFVTPAAGDSGVAVGAAVYGHSKLSGKIPQWHSYSDFLGASYGAERFASAVRRSARRVRSSEPRNPAVAAADDVAAGRVVGWVQGPSELGPRALGHRSILCDARIESIRDHLNERVKFREPFRPYAAAVLEEYAGEYFEVEWIDRFMLSVVRIRPAYREQLPSICHVDGTCRVQMVAGGDGAIRELIEAFHGKTGLPLVLNTSMNIRGEPMVETPEDAIQCFLGANIDVAYLDGRRLEKPVLNPEDPNPALVPTPNDGVDLRIRTEWETPGWSQKLHSVHRPSVTRGTTIDAVEAATLLRLDGQASVAEIASNSRIGPEERVVEALASLQQRGLISMAYPVSTGDRA